jgi:6-pyruvoyltetrahydropterin/6-carboxytetrahydropterin synthase
VSRVSLNRRVSFSAAHRYRRPEWDDAKNAEVFGHESLTHDHSHDYVCDVSVVGPINPTTGMVLNLVDLDAALRAEVTDRFDQKNLNNDVAEFADGKLIPTCENIAKLIAERVQARIGVRAKVSAVTVAENPTLSATWRVD